MTAKKSDTDSPTPPSLGDYLLEVQRRDPAEGDFALEAPDLLAVKVDGRVRARAYELPLPGLAEGSRDRRGCARAGCGFRVALDARARLARNPRPARASAAGR